MSNISQLKKKVSVALSSLGCREESVSLPFPISRGFLQTSLVGLSGKESACQCTRHRFDPWVGKIPWRRKRQPSPLFLPGKFHGQRTLAGYNPWGSKKSGYLSNFLMRPASSGGSRGTSGTPCRQNMGISIRWFRWIYACAHKCMMSAWVDAWMDQKKK